MDNDEYFILNRSHDAKAATAFVVDLLFKSWWPLIINVRRKLQSQKCEEYNTNIAKDMITLCCSQIKKCILTLFDIFKLELQYNIILKETRYCTTERLAWCVNKIKAIEKSLDKISNSNEGTKNPDDFLNFTSPMYFVSWIDHAFEVLAKLSHITYEENYKESTELFETWKSDVIECLRELHVCLDELLLSAVTLSKHCLKSDQHIVKARCQVVLREAKALLSELVIGDPEKSINVTKESLKLPVKPSNVNVLIDVLKDVLYALETNTNTALLSLLVHCFSNTVNPVDYLKIHFRKGSKGTCPCSLSDGCLMEDCYYVKDFDTYNERLLQIGSFAVSCSSDQKRILTLRSGLASLEALDPHLVPAMMLSLDCHHTNLMIRLWLQEVQEIRDCVFLIVDPAAFAERANQMMHQRLLDVMQSNCYDSVKVCSVINIGSVIKDFFTVYFDNEPDALSHHEQLMKLLTDVSKVEVECKIMNNLLSSENDILYDVKKPVHYKEPNFGKLLKRLKLLYTLVDRINSLYHPEDNEDQLFVDEICEGEAPPKVTNLTHTVQRINANTYVNLPREPDNISRSIFARTSNLGSVSNTYIVSRMNRQLQLKRKEELSFSMQLDELLDNSESESKTVETHIANKDLTNARERSILYNYSPKKDRSCLRMAVLTRNHKLPLDIPKTSTELLDSVISDTGEMMDENTSLQITEILDQMTDLSNTFAVITKPPMNSICTITPAENSVKKNILSLIVNQGTAVSKHVWNIPVNTSTVEMSLDGTGSTKSNLSNTSSQHSDFSTLERLNDLNIVQIEVECKIMNNLLSSENDILYDVKKPVHYKEPNFGKLLKRLKLLYTLVDRINSLYHPEDNEDQLFVDEICEGEAPPKVTNLTHTVQRINANTYVNLPREPDNISRSIFARTSNLGSVSNTYIVSRMNRQLQLKRKEELSFSMQLDELLDNSESESKTVETHIANKDLTNARERSILYNYSPKKDRSCLRMAVLTRNHKLPLDIPKTSTELLDSVISDTGEMMDENTSLQITEILDQMTDLSNTFAVITKPPMNSICTITPAENSVKKNILSLNVNQGTAVSKHVWNIPVNTSTVEMSLDGTGSTKSNLSNTSSQHSDFSTLERLNDLNIVQSKLNDLKLFQQETSL